MLRRIPTSFGAMSSGQQERECIPLTEWRSRVAIELRRADAAERREIRGKVRCCGTYIVAESARFF